MAVNTSSTADKLRKKATVIGGGAVNTVSSSPAKKEQKGGMMALLEKMEPEIQKALPATMRSDRMIRLALTAFRANPKLKQADPATFVAAVMQSSQLGLEPNTTMGEAYIIPRYNSHAGQMEATFQIGYRGILSLAHRTGQYQSIYAEQVYENDRFEYELGLHKKLVHVPADLPQGEPKYYYAVYHLVNGGYDFVVWSRAKVQLHAKRFSASLKKDMSTPWKTNFDSMAKKTVLLDLLKYAPKSIEFSQQLSLDNTVKKDVEAEPERVIIDMEPEEEQQLGQHHTENDFEFGPEPPVNDYYNY
ncbi:recombinase RecT [Peribacillus asahii]|uniref:recombinase RecT n=1 Tax=Peribacillus asahii TaxID=228899 RepID=UPI0020793E89|nr:recombinase RecT [Peribacillus asahii]USK72661.1 recombinase RecT [Peribacillus asahii]USK72697.1 recombinase RecT [Peribacillus asahii]